MSAYCVFIIILHVFVNFIILSKAFNNRFYPRVRGGRTAAADEYPYIVAFEARYPDDGVYYRQCTGTLISKTWVLTAAHCLHSKIYCVRFGDMTVPRNDTRYFSEVIKMFPHRKYKLIKNIINNEKVESTQYDIALVLVKKVKMQIVGKLSAIDYKTLMGQRVIYAGYGATSQSEIYDRVRYQLKPLQIGEGVVGYCSGLTDYFAPAFCVTPKCTANMASGLPGDSGGPLFSKNKIVGVFCGLGKTIGAYAPCFVTCSVGLNIMGHGCVLGFAAVLLPQLHQPGSSITLTKEAASWIASIIGIMMMVGTIVMSYVMGQFGRKIAHFAVTVPAIAGWTATIFAGSFEILLLGSIFGGLSFGMHLTLRSVLIGEYTSTVNRGAFLTMVSFTQGFGIFFVHLIGALMTWRIAAMVCLFFPIASLIMIFFCPESPSWYAAKGRYDECRKVFRWLRGDDEEIELERMIQARIEIKNEAMRSSGNKLKDIILIIQKKEFYKPIILMVHANCMIQFSGGTTLASYSTRILDEILGPNGNSDFWMIVLDTERIVLNAAAAFVINRTKRRTMMFSTGGMCVVSHLAISAYVYLKNQGSLPYETVWIPVTLSMIHYSTVATGMVPLPNVIGGEVFPLEYKSIGSMISMWSLSAIMFLTLKSFPPLIERTGLEGTYLVYAGILTYNLLVIWLLLPETKGRTLQEIEDEFRGKTVVDVCECDSSQVQRKESAKNSASCSVPLLK